jgi:hypothetical protein
MTTPTAVCELARVTSSGSAPWACASFAEIQDLDSSVSGDENILGLEIAVDYSLFMRRR